MVASVADEFVTVAGGVGCEKRVIFFCEISLILTIVVLIFAFSTILGPRGSVCVAEVARGGYEQRRGLFGLKS